MKYRAESDELLVKTAAAGLGLADLSALFAEMYERARSELPDEDPDRAGRSCIASFPACQAANADCPTGNGTSCLRSGLSAVRAGAVTRDARHDHLPPPIGHGHGGAVPPASDRIVSINLVRTAAVTPRPVR